MTSTVYADASGQCAPINGLIPFTGEGIYRDSSRIVGGKLPFSAQTTGKMEISNGAYLGGINQGEAQGAAYGRAGSDGTIRILETKIQTIEDGYSRQAAVNIQGTIEFSYLVIQDIMARFSGAFTLNNEHFWLSQSGQKEVCASGIALDIGHERAMVYGGKVYLDLNGTNHGYVLYF